MSRRVPGRQLAPLLALVLGTLLFVGACGDDDGGDASPTPGDGTAQPTASPGGVTAAPVTFPASIDACDLLRIDELVPFLGSEPIIDSGSAEPEPDFAFCTWGGDYGGELSSVSLQLTTSPTAFESFKKEPGYEPLEDLGDEAYVQTSAIVSADLPSGSVIVKDGIYYVFLSSSGPLQGNEAREHLSNVLRRLLQNLP